MVFLWIQVGKFGVSIYSIVPSVITLNFFSIASVVFADQIVGSIVTVGIAPIFWLAINELDVLP